MDAPPFKFGDVVTGRHFTNRDREIARLHANFASQQNTVIISPRRYGKSSLVKEAAKRFMEKENGFIFCFVDLMKTCSEIDFYTHFATSILKSASTGVEGFLRLAGNVIKGTRVTINTGTGEPSLELGVQQTMESPEKILNLAQVIAEKRNKKVIMAIDEFQNISRYDKDQELQGRLRASWQHHQDVAYLLYGSRITMMTEIFNKTNSPFYRFGEIIFLNRIGTEWLSDFMKRSFQSTGKTITDEICHHVIDLVENHPYYLQQFSRNLWLISGKEVTVEDVSMAKQAIMADNLNFYTEILENLTLNQANLLKALLNNETHMYSAEVINTYRLGSSANVSRILEALTEKGIIVKEVDRIILTDPVFKMIAAERLT